MKLTLFIGALTVSVSAVMEYQQASRLVPSLAPRISDTSAAPTETPSANNPVSSKTFVTRNDTCVKFFAFDDLLALNKKFFDNFIAPNNAVQAKSINSSLLAIDVQGRVDITRTFDGQELNTEYLFGLFANLALKTNNTNDFSLLGTPQSYEIVHFAASQNIAAASVRFEFYFAAVNLTLPVQIQTWNVYNCDGEIIMYDASFLGWFQWALATLLAAAQQQISDSLGKDVSLAQTMEYVQSKVSASVCTTAQQYCVGELQQYTSYSECYNFLTNKTRLGEAYELGRNTVYCRMVHQNMVPLRPAVHCPHIGPSGGGYCVDSPSYEDTVGENYFTNAPFVYGNTSSSG